MEQTAIVIGGNHHNTLGAIRSLGRSGVQSIVILHSGSADNYILKSKYVSNYTVVEKGDDIYSALKGLKKDNEKQVVVCTSDLSASVIDQHRKELMEFFYLPGCDEQGRLTSLMNKEVMSELAVQSGLNIPQSIILSNSDYDYSDVVFPCITKPLMSIAGSKADIAICHNAEQLSKSIKNSQAQKFQVQKYIEKDSEYQLIGVCGKGWMLIPGKSIIVTQPLGTNTGYLKYVNLDGSEPLAECEKFLMATGYSGLFSMEFIRDSEGRDYFMEINFRNDGNAICVTEAGVNLPFIWYQYCIDHNIPKTDEQRKIKEVFVMPEYTEISLWYKGDISFLRLIKELRQANSFMEYDADDPNPTNGKKDFLSRFVPAVLRKPVKSLARVFIHK